ncbi:MAG: hypothetical protein J5995_00600 [Muribaculaceae bacterium]|nr:hypothetical protein [Muribaculaceae bacterium]
MDSRQVSRYILAIALTLIIAGCSGSGSPYLYKADAIIEEHPDSALSILVSHPIADNASEYDKAFYRLLLTYARYKNQADESNDSVIGLSVNYFIDHGHTEEAVKSLFMEGTIRLNGQDYEGAAVSFATGMDLAEDVKDYFWKGKCARGLFKIFQNLMNGSGQVKYAEEEYRAFQRSGNGDWLIVARLDLAIAHNNKGLHNKAASEAEELVKSAKLTNNTSLMIESQHLKAVSLFAAGDHIAALNEYIELFQIAPETFDDSDIANISVALNETGSDPIHSEIREYIDSCHNDQDDTSFESFAMQGNFKEAYESLEVYRMKQDSVLSVVLRKNVTESVERYHDNRKLKIKSDAQIERLKWALAVVLLLAGAVITAMIFRRRIEEERFSREALIKDAECIKSDLLRQLKDNRTLSASLEDSFRKRHAVMESLCSAYYVESQNKTDENKNKSDKNDIKTDRNKNKTEGNKIKSEISSIIDNFRNDVPYDELEESANRCSGNLITSLKKDFPETGERELRLFIYFVIGFSTRTISILFDEKIENIYNRKSRLKKKINASDSPRKEEYLSFL